MVSVNVRPSRAARHVDDGDIVLTNGRTTLLSDIPGGSWNRQKLERLAAAVQRDMDTRHLITDLALDDSDRIMAALPDADAQFAAKYGGNGFIDGDSIVFRSDLISFILSPDGDVFPLIEIV